MNHATKTFPVQRYRSSEPAQSVDDEVVVEEPLGIRINGRRFSATMRTPGAERDDAWLARGLLFTEGVIRESDEILEISSRTICRERSDELLNIVDVTLEDDGAIPAHLWERSLVSNSSCGLCGKASIDVLLSRVTPLPSHETLNAPSLVRLSTLLRKSQPLFAQTGGLHAAAAFCVGEDGETRVLCAHEDIGRHNATDKVIGQGLEEGWIGREPPSAAEGVLVLLVSGRASFEIVQKALVARFAVVCAVSAASSLAVEIARAGNQTLVGFLRDDQTGAGLTCYTGGDRIIWS